MMLLKQLKRVHTQWSGPVQSKQQETSQTLIGSTPKRSWITQNDNLLFQPSCTQSGHDSGSPPSSAKKNVEASGHRQQLRATACQAHDPRLRLGRDVRASSWSSNLLQRVQSVWIRSGPVVGQTDTRLVNHLGGNGVRICEAREERHRICSFKKILHTIL